MSEGKKASEAGGWGQREVVDVVDQKARTRLHASVLRAIPNQISFPYLALDPFYPRIKAVPSAITRPSTRARPVAPPGLQQRLACQIAG